MEGTIARISCLSIGHQNLKESSTFDSYVEGVVCGGKVALRLDDLSFRRSSTEADLQTCSYSGLLRCGGARYNLTLIQKIRKIQLSLLKTCGTRVRQIIGYVIQVQLLGRHPTGGCIKGTKHIKFLSKLTG
jgi:hypothetical protein